MKGFPNYDINKYICCWDKALTLMNAWMILKNSIKHYMKKKIFAVN